MFNKTTRPALCSYFSSDARALAKEVEGCLTHPKFGPHHHKQQRDDQAATEAADFAFCPILVPHGAYCDGGPIAANGFAELARRQHNTATFIVIGNCHGAVSPPVFLTDEAYATPLGVVPLAVDLCAALHRRASLPINAAAHRKEHSIENQVPFLQTLFDPKALSLVPIMVSNVFGRVSEIEPLAEAIASVVVASPTSTATVGLVGSTDFSHVGPFYGEMPPRGTTTEAYTRARDMAVIDQILALNAVGLAPSEDGKFQSALEAVVGAGSQTSMCGLWSAVLTLLLTHKLRQKKSLQAADIKLLRYAVASEIFFREDVTGFGAFTL